jgi:hypothetical protein
MKYKSDLVESNITTNARDPKGHEIKSRIHDALRNLNAFKSDSWDAMDGGFVLEYIEGPYAYEVAQELIETAMYPGTKVLNIKDISFIGSFADQHRVQLIVRGLRLELRALDPIGFDAALRALKGA